MEEWLVNHLQETLSRVALVRRLAVSTAAALFAAFIVVAFAPQALAQAGTLDTTFSGDGKLTTDFTSSYDASYAVALQADGRIVAVGAAGRGGRFALSRYNPNGTLDTAFGSDGKVTTDFTSNYDAAWGVIIQPDGKIVAAGDAGLGSSNSKFAVARYNANGTLDTSFAGDGKVTTQFTPRDDPVAGLAIQPDGKILVSGGAGVGGSNPKLAAARYNTDGILDSTLSGDGRIMTDFTPGLDYANAIAVQPDGKIVAAGLGVQRRSNSFALARYNPDGTLDTSFSGDGRLLTNFSRRDDSVQGLAIQPDGKIVAGGLAGSGGSDPSFALARYNTDGMLDTTFSGDGKVTTQFSSNFDAAWGVGLQTDGKIVAAGEAAGRGGRIALARYNPNGTLDVTFSDDGKVNTNLTSRRDFARGIAIQDDAKIVLSGVSGGSNPKFALVRYLAS
jgi:uncharacterized delta-60 repeat protein